MLFKRDDTVVDNLIIGTPDYLFLWPLAGNPFLGLIAADTITSDYTLYAYLFRGCHNDDIVEVDTLVETLLEEDGTFQPRQATK